MAPKPKNFQDLNQLEGGSDEHAPIHYSRKIIPNTEITSTAWNESDIKPKREKVKKSRERAKLLEEYSNVNHKTKEGKQKKEINNCNDTDGKIIPKVVTKWDKYRQRICHLMKPPMFITAVVCIMILLHILLSNPQKLLLEWNPGPWWLKPWKFLSYGIIHNDDMHISLNAFMALIVGWSLEREQRWWRVGLLWMGGLISGSLGVGVFQPKVRVVGASAAVFALLTSHVPNVCLRYGHISMVWFRLLSVGVLFTSEVVHHCLLTHYLKDERVAWSSHFTGAAVGVLFGFVIYTGENRAKYFYVRCVSVVLIVCALLFAIYY